MNSLSQKQIILIDTIDKIQSSTNDKINKLDNKILSLENNIESLNNKLNTIRSNNNNYNY
jgi:archaellum component FlaC